MKLHLSKSLLYRLAVWIILSIFLGILVESNNQIDLILFLRNHPSVFFVNTVLIAGYLSFSFLFKRQLFVLSLLSTIVAVLGIANTLVTKFRGVPLSYVDLFSIQDGFSLITQYLSFSTILFIGFFLLLFLLCVVYLFRFKVENYRRELPYVIFFYLVLHLASNGIVMYAQEHKIVEDRNWDLLENARSNGFVYSFVRSYELSIIEIPKYYEQTRLEELALTKQQNESIPTIIFYQLESFMDPYNITSVNYSKDPMGYYRSLQEDYTSGILRVPTYGGGTVRTEFEVITGMSLDFFPPGEIPFNSVAKNHVLETPAFVLKEEGIHSTFIHNFEGNFYNRNLVYSNLGFDTFVSMEYMETIPYKQHFPDDTHVITKITESIEESEGSDFIFAIGVEGHGPYRDEYQENPYDIEVYTDLETEDLRRIQDYIYKMIRVQESIETLVNYIHNQEEDIILVLYSDHLPNLASQSIKYENENRYETSYVIVDNFNVEKQDEDITSYQLLSKVFEMIDVYGGVLPLYHERYKKDEYYLENLHLLQHDLSYGLKFTNNKDYEKTKLKFGIEEIMIESTQYKNQYYEIKGDHFSFASTILLNGKQIPTVFVDEKTLYIEVELRSGDVLTVGQLGRYDTILSSSSPFIVE